MVFEFSVFRFQFSDCGIRGDVFGFDCGYSEENCTGGAPVPPGLPAAVFKARMRENAREGQKLQSNHFVGGA